MIGNRSSVGLEEEKVLSVRVYVCVYVRKKKKQTKFKIHSVPWHSHFSLSLSHTHTLSLTHTHTNTDLCSSSMSMTRGSKVWPAPTWAFPALVWGEVDKAFWVGRTRRDTPKRRRGIFIIVCNGPSRLSRTQRLPNGRPRDKRTNLFFFLFIQQCRCLHEDKALSFEMIATWALLFCVANPSHDDWLIFLSDYSLSLFLSPCVCLYIEPHWPKQLLYQCVNPGDNHLRCPVICRFLFWFILTHTYIHTHTHALLDIVSHS